MHDFRYALRMLRKRPGFTAVAVLALALGIGANTAIFSVVNAVLLRPLPFRQPDRLVMIWQRIISPSQNGPLLCSSPDYIDYRDQTRTLQDVAAFTGTSFNMATPAGVERVMATSVSANVFQLLGAAPVRGRVFTAEEDNPQNGHLVMLSYGAWERRFGADPGVLGRTLVLDRQPYKVIGVMPKNFNFPLGFSGSEAPDLWVPIAFTPAQLGPDGRGDNFNISVIGRLKPGVTIQQANADIDRIAVAFVYAAYPANIQKLFKMSGFVRDLREQLVGNTRMLLLVLLGAVGFVLLIGCANVANLLLAKAAGRRREVAVRTALGASRSRLLRQMLTESLLLGFLGGGVGLLLAAWLVQLLIRFGPENVPRLAESEVDGTVFGFTLALSLVTAIIFGLAPALQASRTNLNLDLKEGSRGASAFRRSRLRSALIVAEVALSLVLLTGAGLLVRSFVRLLGVPVGFRPDHVLTLSVALPESKYGTGTQVVSFYRDLLARVQTVPGVESAAAGTGLPFVGQWTILVTVEDDLRAGKKEIRPAIFQGVTPEFHQTLGIRLKTGRFLTTADQAATLPVAVVNETMARQYWPNQQALGKRFKWGPEQSSRTWITVVGVVEDSKQNSLAAKVKPGVYLPFAQMPEESIGKGGIRGMVLAVRTASDPSAVISDLRGVVRSLDPEVPMFAVRPMNEVLQSSVAPRRFNMLLLASFAALALLLASIGIYGVMSYSVTQHTQEIGIRMALGARANDVVRLIVRQGMLLVLLGLAAGAAGAFALTRLLSTLLFQVKPNDPITFASVSVLLAAVAFLANYIPARRATKVDPLVALRYE